MDLGEWRLHAQRLYTEGFVFYRDFFLDYRITHIIAAETDTCSQEIKHTSQEINIHRNNSEGM